MASTVPEKGSSSKPSIIIDKVCPTLIYLKYSAGTLKSNFIGSTSTIVKSSVCSLTGAPRLILLRLIIPSKGACIKESSTFLVAISTRDSAAFKLARASS